MPTDAKPIDLLCMGEPMLEFNQQPVGADGRRLYLEGFGGIRIEDTVVVTQNGYEILTPTSKDLRLI